jgi:hypothetical protein
MHFAHAYRHDPRDDWIVAPIGSGLSSVQGCSLTVWRLSARRVGEVAGAKLNNTEFSAR